MPLSVGNIMFAKHSYLLLFPIIIFIVIKCAELNPNSPDDRKPVLTVMQDTAVSINDSFYVCVSTNNPGSRGLKFVWDIPELELKDTIEDSLLKISFKDTGSFKIVVFAINQKNRVSDPDTFRISVYAKPPAIKMVTEDSIFSVCDTVTFTVEAFDSDGVVKAYLWSFGNQKFDTTETANYKRIWLPDSTGTKNLYVKCIDDDGFLSKTVIIEFEICHCTDPKDAFSFNKNDTWKYSHKRFAYHYAYGSAEVTDTTIEQLTMRIDSVFCQNGNIMLKVSQFDSGWERSGFPFNTERSKINNKYSQTYSIHDDSMFTYANGKDNKKVDIPFWLYKPGLAYDSTNKDGSFSKGKSILIDTVAFINNYYLKYSEVSWYWSKVPASMTDYSIQDSLKKIIWIEKIGLTNFETNSRRGIVGRYPTTNLINDIYILISFNGDSIGQLQ
jgi:hypothetical protein